MPDRKYTYKVEIDAQQAKAQAEALRQTMQKALGDIDAPKHQQMLRQATAQVAAEARQQTIAVQQEQRRQTAQVQAEAHMRVTLVRAEADAIAQAARAATAERIEQEKRITAEVRAEIRQRERAERTAQAQSMRLAPMRPTMGGAFRGFDAMAGMAVGGLGALGAVQVGRMAYDAAQQGAILERQQATFREFSQRMNQDANAIVEAVKRASNATMTEFDAMGMASQVLASKFAEGRADIAADLETVTAFSRRASQIYVDKQTGQALNVQEVFSRMVGFAREGNKELVDQFGITNQAIAEAMGVTVEAFSGADGAALRWQGLIKVLESEMKRLGPAAITAADKFEQSAARIEEARQRIQMAIAQPIAGLAEGVAGGVEFGATALGISGLDTVRKQIAEMTGGDTASIKAATEALKSFDAAMKSNAAGAASYAMNLNALLQPLVVQKTLVAEDVTQLERLSRTLNTVAEGMDAYTIAMQVTTEEGLRHIQGSFGIARAMAAYQSLYEEGSVTFEQYSEQMVEFAARLRAAADASGYLSQQLADTYSMIGPIPQGGTGRRIADQERTPFLDPEKSPWAPAAGISERQAAAMAELAAWRQQQNEEMNRIINETQNPAMQNVRTGIVDQLAGAEDALSRLTAAYEMLGDSSTAAMTQNLDAISEQVNRLQMLDQAAMLVDAAMREGQAGAAGFAQSLSAMASEVSATNTVTAAQVGILQSLIGSLLGATSAAMGFAGAQTQYQAAMAAKSAKYEMYAGYNYAALAPRFDNENRAGQREAMYNRVVEERRIAAEAERAYASAAKQTASDFEAAAEKSARAFESALQRVPGLFDSSSVTGDQMAGAAAGIPQNFADNYLRRLADEVGGARDWEGIDIRDAALRAGVDPGLPPEMILQQVRGAWDDSSLFAGGRNLDLITQFGGLEAIKANIARQEAGASGEQALLGLLQQEGAAPADAITAEGAPATAEATVMAIEEAFSAEQVTTQLRAVGENAIAAIHSGYASNAGELNWAGPLVDAVAAQVLDSLSRALSEP